MGPPAASYVPTVRSPIGEHSIPRTFFKNWTSAFVLVFALLSALVAVKFRLTLWFIATLSCVLIPLTSNRYLLIASMVALFAYLLAHLGRHLRVAFRPITVFDRGSRWVAGQWNGVKDTLFRNNIAALATLPPDSENFRKKRFESLNNLLVWNSLFLFVSSKLKRLSESRIMIGYCLASLLYTSAITIVAYAFEYYALAKHSPSNFDGYTGQGFWFFMYFSFNTILRAGSGSFSAASPISRFLTVLEVATGVYIGGILIWLIITVFRERYTDEVKRLVEGLNREGDALETVIVDELHMSRQEAEAEVRQINPQSADFITRLGWEAERFLALPSPWDLAMLSVLRSPWTLSSRSIAGAGGCTEADWRPGPMSPLVPLDVHAVGFLPFRDDCSEPALLRCDGYQGTVGYQRSAL
jgi:hypothetical protein